jgi:hypothetical protein
VWCFHVWKQLYIVNLYFANLFKERLYTMHYILLTLTILCAPLSDMICFVCFTCSARHTCTLFAWRGAGEWVSSASMMARSCRGAVEQLDSARSWQFPILSPFKGSGGSGGSGSTGSSSWAQGGACCRRGHGRGTPAPYLRVTGMGRPMISTRPSRIGTRS